MVLSQIETDRGNRQEPGIEQNHIETAAEKQNEIEGWLAIGHFILHWNNYCTTDH